MDAASVLKVKVLVDGLAKATGEVKAFEADLQKAGVAGEGAGSGFDRAGSSAEKAAGQVTEARKATDLWRDSTGKLRNSVGQFATDAEKLRAGVGGVGDESKRSTQDFEGFSAGLNRARGVVAQANQELQRTGVVSTGTRNALSDLGSRGVKGVEADITKMNRTLDKAGTELTNTGNLSRRTARDLENLGSSGGGLGGISTALAAFGGSGFSGFGGTIAATIPIVVALTGSVIALGSALGPLAGIAGAAAVGLAAAAQGFGVFKLATSGIAAALKEQTTAQNSTTGAAITAAQQQRAAATSIRNAQDGVRTATEQVGTATRGLANAQTTARDAQTALTAARTDARRALIDMHSSLDDALVAEQRAILGLQDARQALATTLAGTSPEDLAKAQAAVTDALHGQEQATNAVNQAQANYDTVEASSTSTALQKAQALADLHSAQDGVTQAAFDATDAQNALMAAQAVPSDEDKKKALLDVADAQNQVATSTRDRERQQKDTNAADKAGVAGAAAVVAAQKAIKQANQQVTTAQRALADANRGVTRAVRAVHDAQLNAASSAASQAAGAAKLHTALDALSPPARAFVQHLIALKPKLDELKKTAAQGFFPGATKGLDAAMRSFVPVNKVVGETSKSMGDLTNKAGELVGSKGFGKDIETVGKRNSQIISILGDAALHLVDALRNVIVVAGPLTTWLAKVADGWAQQLDAASKADRENGKMAAFFDRTRQVLTTLASIIGNVTGGLVGVGHAGTASGNDILKSISAAAERFDRWANSVKGQTSITRFFREARDLIANLIPVLTGIGKATATMGLGPMSTALRIAGPYAQELTYAFLAYKTAATAAAIASNVMAAATKALAAGEWLLNVALDANPIVLIVAGLVALAAGFVLAYKKIKWFRDLVNTVFDWIKDHWPLLLDILLGPIGVATGEIIQHWGTVKRVTESVFGAIKSFLVGVWSTIGSIASTAWHDIKTAITTPISAAVDVIKAVIGHGGKGSTGLVGFLAGGWTTIANGITAFASGVKDAITGAFKGAANLVISFVNEIIKAINLIPGVPNIKPIKKLAQGGTTGTRAVAGATEGLYRGGLVNKPIVMMGEEAPRHPEWVIPTNPAYRKRALMLHTQAGKALGLAQGGIFSEKQIEGIWRTAGGAPAAAHTMGVIAEAESSGDSTVVNSIGATGLWQILGQVFPGNLLDPIINAKNAIVKSDNGRNLHPWDASRPVWGLELSGVGGNVGSGTGVLGAIGNAISGATGVLGHLASEGAGFILDKLPGIGDLPGWLKGAGKYVLGHVTGWIKDKVAGLVGDLVPGGSKWSKDLNTIKNLGTFDGLPVANWIIPELQYARAHDWTGGITSGWRSPSEVISGPVVAPQGQSEHQGTVWPHGAVDFGGPIDPIGLANKKAFEAAAAGYKGHKLLEAIGFRDDGHMSGTGHKLGGILGQLGGPYGGAPFVGSYRFGGTIPQDGYAYVHRGETVTPDGGNDELVAALERHATALDRLNDSGTADVIRGLTKVLNKKLGEAYAPRARTAGSGVVARLP